MVFDFVCFGGRKGLLFLEIKAGQFLEKKNANLGKKFLQKSSICDNARSVFAAAK